MVTKKKIIEFLNERDVQDVDHIIIDELIFNQHLIKEAKADIKTRGLNINVSKDPQKPYYQTNPSIATYNSAIKNILNISRKLGLSPADRKALKMEVVESDGF